MDLQQLILQLMGGAKDTEAREPDDAEYLPPPGNPGAFDLGGTDISLMEAVQRAQADPQLPPEYTQMRSEFQDEQGEIQRRLADIMAAEAQEAERRQRMAATSGQDVGAVAAPQMPVPAPRMAPQDTSQYASLDRAGPPLQRVGPTQAIRPAPTRINAPSIPALETANPQADLNAPPAPDLSRRPPQAFNPTRTTYPMPQNPIVNGGPFQTMAPAYPYPGGDRPAANPPGYRPSPLVIGPGGVTGQPGPTQVNAPPPPPPQAVQPQARTQPIGAGYGGQQLNGQGGPVGNPPPPAARFPNSNEGRPGFSAEELNRQELQRFLAANPMPPVTSAQAAPPGPVSPPVNPNMRTSPPPAPLPANLPPGSVQTPVQQTSLVTQMPDHLKEQLLMDAARLTASRRSGREAAR